MEVVMEKPMLSLTNVTTNCGKSFTPFEYKLEKGASVLKKKHTKETLANKIKIIIRYKQIQN